MIPVHDGLRKSWNSSEIAQEIKFTEYEYYYSQQTHRPFPGLKSRMEHINCPERNDSTKKQVDETIYT